MNNLKRGVLAMSAGSAVILLMKKRRAASVLAAGVSLAVLASEYPETFRKIREDLPYYFERGTRVFDLASKVGQSIAARTRDRSQDLLDDLTSYT
jgi:hypothetical protein